MATIKEIEGRAVHQIQSGQVIVDICSVIKELVENSLDAGATIIDVKFKNQGLDTIEIQDNGDGIPPHNYETIALKHHTSKLSLYSDLLTLKTFGFRGEALSSLCALAQVSIVTCLAQDAPKATKLEFETSGKLKEKNVVAAQKGTTVVVQNIFRNLPVRRRELERNIKREWSKVTSVLGQYACIQTGIKFSVSHQTDKGKKTTIFSTKGNINTKENIVNVFGAKMLTSLIPLDLALEIRASGGYSQRKINHSRNTMNKIRIVGHISRPTSGENRQTPDRQMFFVNTRPCSMPQINKVLNEVFKSFNGSSPSFIFANLELDTHLYDVNVSPDKRTILLHNEGEIIETLRSNMSTFLESRDNSMPLSRFDMEKQPSYRQSMIVYDRKSPMSKTPSKNGADLKQDHELEEGLTPSKEKSLNINELNFDSQNQSDLLSPSNIELISMCPEDLNRTPTKAEINSGYYVKAHDQDIQPKLNHLAFNLDMIHKRSEQDKIQDESLNTIGYTPGSLCTPKSKNKRHEIDYPFYENLSELPCSKKICKVEKIHTISESTFQESESAQQKSPSIDSSLLKNPFTRNLSSDITTIKIGDRTKTYSTGTPCPSRIYPNCTSSPVEFVDDGLNAQTKSLSEFGRNLSQMFSASNSGNPSQFTSLTNKSIDEAIEELVSPNLSQTSSMTFECPLETNCETPEVVYASQSSNTTIICDDVEPTSDLSASQESQTLEEVKKKHADEAIVQELIQDAENSTKNLSQESVLRTKLLVKGLQKKYSTLNLVQVVNTDVYQIRAQLELFQNRLSRLNVTRKPQSNESNELNRQTELDEFDKDIDALDAEEKLSLTVTKGDFLKMKVIGQFNLGFIIVFRSADSQNVMRKSSDEIFIIDQHASDEKYNFERLQATTILQSQKLAVPKPLELTAVEEEVVIDNLSTLQNNGFVLSVDHSGDRPIGNRCELTSLPLSRETTFSLTDFEELISLLIDYPHGNLPRPSKVLKMLAMRACRSSIMIGKTLTRKQMEKIVAHLSELDKPWNCPHGRPTMRHLCGLSYWDAHCWKEDTYSIGKDLISYISHHRISTVSASSVHLEENN